MTSQMLFALLGLVLQLLANVSSNAIYQKVISAITTFLPEIEKAEPAIVQSFHDIITDLSGNPDLTADQVSTMLTAKATLDARLKADIAATLGTGGTPA